MVLHRNLVAALVVLLASCAITRPTVTKVTDNYFMVAYALRYSTPDNKHQIVVPVGFFTDLTSIPRGLWWWESPIDRSMAPAIVHDYLYWEQSCTKPEADAVLYLALGEAGMGDLKRFGIYEGVAKAGQSSWDNNRQHRLDGESRFLTEPYARQLQASNIDSKSTLAGVLAEADKQHAVVRPTMPNASNKAVCVAALEYFNKISSL